MAFEEEKKAIRLEAKRRRSFVDRKRKDKEIASRLFSLKEYQRTDGIFIYMSFRDEVDTKSIIEEAWREGKQVACPLVKGREMAFLEVMTWDDFLPGRMGILEPKQGKKIVTVNNEKGLMIMPGLAFDRGRRRIGYGGGYYDRYLENRENQFVTVALAYMEQIWERLPSTEQDIRPDMIITEEGIINESDDNGTTCQKSSGFSEWDGKYGKK